MLTEPSAFAPGPLDRIRFVLESAARRLPRLKTRTKRWIQFISLFLLGLISVWALYYVFTVDDYKAAVGHAEVPEQIRFLNDNVKRGHLTRKPLIQLHGDLSAIPKPANWKHQDYDSNLHFPLDRSPIDYREHSCKAMDYGSKLPKTSVIFIFANEPFETLLRSVHSVLNTSPPELLDEIILVDDGSDAEYIKPRKQGGSGLLEDYIALLPKVRLVRQGARTGIVAARLRGVNEVKSETFVILDSHIECQPGWLQPLLYPIGKDRTVVTMPHIDGIGLHDFALMKGGVGCTLGLIWNMMEHAFYPIAEDKKPFSDIPVSLMASHPDVAETAKLSPPAISPEDRRQKDPTKYVSSPAMAGGLFAANTKWFLELGGYDEGMTGWGAENVEFSLRLWQCGGKLLCTECSRVNHMFGGGKFYSTKSGSTTVNRMRTIAAWLDQYADVSWHILGRPSFSEIGDISRLQAIKNKLKCKPFQWFLDNVYPESYIRQLPHDVPYMGPIFNLQLYRCMSNSYRGSVFQPLVDCKTLNSKQLTQIYWRRPGYLTSEASDETCLVQHGGGIKWDWCNIDTKWHIQEVAYYDREKAGFFKLEDEFNEEVMSEFKDAKDFLYTELSHIYKEYGNLVLVRIQDHNRRMCLSDTSASKKSAPVLAPCDASKSEQLWIWTQYQLNPYWANSSYLN